jgi:hypothetical protein
MLGFLCCASPLSLFHNTFALKRGRISEIREALPQRICHLRVCGPLPDRHKKETCCLHVCVVKRLRLPCTEAVGQHRSAQRRSSGRHRTGRHRTGRHHTDRHRNRSHTGGRGDGEEDQGGTPTIRGTFTMCAVGSTSKNNCTQAYSRFFMLSPPV